MLRARWRGEDHQFIFSLFFAWSRRAIPATSPKTITPVALRGAAAARELRPAQPEAMRARARAAVIREGADPVALQARPAAVDPPESPGEAEPAARTLEGEPAARRPVEEPPEAAVGTLDPRARTANHNSLKGARRAINSPVTEVSVSRCIATTIGLTRGDQG